MTVAKDWCELAVTDWYDKGIGDTYTINTANTAAELARLALLVNRDEDPVDFAGKTIEFGSDIDLLELEWVPIGSINEATELTAAEYSYENVFKGSFDGKGRTISNLKIDKDDHKAVGLFGVISMPTENAEIKNVELVNATVNGYTGVGVLAGMAKAGTTWVSGIGHAAKINDIKVSNATVTGLKYAGGIIGYSTTSVTNSEVSNVGITANYKTGMTGKSGETAGDVVGNLYDNYSVTDCNVTDSTIESQTRAGGIAGSSRYAKDISNCIVSNVTIGLVTSDSEGAENEGYAGYISGRARPSTVAASLDNDVLDGNATIDGNEKMKRR